MGTQGRHAARRPIRLTLGSSLFLFGALLACMFPPARTFAAGSRLSQIIRREADLVVLPVTVTDRHGQFVSGLVAEDFQVYEKGRVQTISLFKEGDVPTTVGLVLDCSESMLPNRSEVVAAARDFWASSNPDDEIFVVNFNERVSLGLPPSVPFTSSAAQLEAAVLRGPSAGMTALYDATALALRHLTVGRNSKKALIIISDGGDNASHIDFRQLLTAAQHSNAVVYAVGIISKSQADTNPAVLRRLAKATGAKAYFPKSAADLPGIFGEIAQDICQQYTIGYVPSNRARDGTYRTVRVSVRAPHRGGLVLRTRQGYFAASGPGADTVRSREENGIPEGRR